MRYAIVLLLFFLGFAVAYAPASLLRRYTNDVPGLDIVDPAGTLWSGSGTILTNGRPLGTANWRVRPLSLLKFHLTYDARLFNSEGSELEVTLDTGLERLNLNVTGSIDTVTLNRVLQNWQLSIAGELSVQHVKSSWRNRELDSLDGELDWAGGQVTFNDPNGTGQATLPALTAALSDDGEGGISALLVTADGQTPLVQGRLQRKGQLSINITKLMTRLVGTPWRGDEPDHAIVISLEETVFRPPDR
ncbi:MAG: type II secretion system protein N [Pseudomonadales bacterium]